MPSKILVANDSLEMCELYQDILSLDAYRTSFYPLDQLSASTIDSAEPDLILLDYLFGIEDRGQRALHGIKNDPATAALPVILCTTMVDEVQKQEAALHTMGVHVVLKPFELDELLGVIRFALDEAHPRP